MNIDRIKQLYNEKKEVHFKLYSLEYTIQYINDKVCIFADLYPKIKREYNTLEEALEYFTVYNEGIITQMDRISNIE